MLEKKKTAIKLWANRAEKITRHTELGRDRPGPLKPVARPPGPVAHMQCEVKLCTIEAIESRWTTLIMRLRNKIPCSTETLAHSVFFVPENLVLCVRGREQLSGEALESVGSGAQSCWRVARPMTGDADASCSGASSSCVIECTGCIRRQRG
jgi:hypothetical protein